MTESERECSIVQAVMATRRVVRDGPVARPAELDDQAGLAHALDRLFVLSVTRILFHQPIHATLGGLVLLAVLAAVLAVVWVVEVWPRLLAALETAAPSTLQ